MKQEAVIQIAVFLLFAAAMFFPAPALAGGDPVRLARLRYSGGGDWYNDPSAIPNLARHMNAGTNCRIAEEEDVVTLGSDDLFSHPFLFVTGHENIKFSSEELDRLRLYLEEGGFVYADDDYGLDKFLRRELKRLYPDKDLVELPLDHGVYRSFFKFGEGWPKIHEHYPGQPRCYGLYVKGRLALLYTYNTNISDGWADPGVHEDPEEVRRKAFEAGANIVIWALTN